MSRLLRALFALLVLAAAPAEAQELITKKQVFELASFATQSGRTLERVKVGWESYGTLNAEKSNAILICHFFSGTSHAAGKYAEAEKVAGYWDTIIGPGKAIDTNRFYVLSSDTLVNLSPGDPNVTTTGPASTNPDTGKPYGYGANGFPVVSIRDFIEVQKKLVDSLGIRKLVMVGGASMGGLVGWDRGADRASNDADVSSIPPIIPYGGFSPVRLEGWLVRRDLPGTPSSLSLLPACADLRPVCLRPSCISWPTSVVPY